MSTIAAAPPRSSVATRTVSERRIPHPVRRSNAERRVDDGSPFFTFSSRCARHARRTSSATGCCSRHPCGLPISTRSLWLPAGRRPRTTPTPFAPGPNANSILLRYRSVRSLGRHRPTRAWTRAWSTFATRVMTSTTWSRFIVSWCVYATSCHVHPPHRSKCGQGAAVRCSDGFVDETLDASAKRPPRFRDVTRASSVSPGSARSQKMTNPPGSLHTPLPPNARDVHSSVSTSPTFGTSSVL